MEQNIQVVNVRDTVNAVLLLLEPQVVAKRLDSVADISPDVRVAADPDKLKGILLTLLSNAIRFTSPGGHVMADVGYPPGMPEDVVMLRVADSGRGMSSDRQAEIFEPSERPHGDGDARVRGAGPGLAASREWARAMGGDLRVRSEENGGSVFTLTLPRG
jgi:two-component system, OmpR family, sensor histidine kinase TorS